VCRGVLNNGEHWGCGRQFVRGDALARHFRPKAGLVCIRELLVEEAAERGYTDLLLQSASTVSKPMKVEPTSMGGPAFNDIEQPPGMFQLPAALLTRFPDLKRSQSGKPTACFAQGGGARVRR
jgi:hypothetical protein